MAFHSKKLIYHEYVRETCCWKLSLRLGLGKGQTHCRFILEKLVLHLHDANFYQTWKLQ
jgi:hypothetical protein